jgi:hypothetical protein
MEGKILNKFNCHTRESGYPESFLMELDSGLRPAGMTDLTTIFGSMTAKDMKNSFSTIS